MIKQQYGTTQVNEVRVSQGEIASIVRDNLIARGQIRGYGFDYSRPIVLWEESGDLIFRFVQSSITTDTESRLITLKTFGELKK